jgi:hypothetical protein
VYCEHLQAFAIFESDEPDSHCFLVEHSTRADFEDGLRQHQANLPQRYEELLKGDAGERIRVLELLDGSEREYPAEGTPEELEAPMGEVLRHVRALKAGLAERQRRADGSIAETYCSASGGLRAAN